MSFARLVQKIKEGFGPEEQEPLHDPLILATAAVLLEIGNADGSLSPAEDGNLLGFLDRKFSLPPDDLRELIEAAEETRNRTIDHFALTNYIRRNTTLHDRIEIVKTMWRMVFSDGILTDYENHMVRKLADLLGLEHKVMIDAKVSVMDEVKRQPPAG